MALPRQNYNDLEQYSRRECVEITGISSPVWGEENVSDVVITMAELMDVEMCEDDISVCRPKQQRIIAKFVRKEIKEKFYKSRRRLSGRTTKDLGYEVENRIYLGESLTEDNKALFRLCLKFKKDKPWITPALKKSIQIKNRYHRKFSKTKSIYFLNKFKLYRDKLNHFVET